MNNKRQKLTDHMTEHHYLYDDTGRIVSESDYRLIVHKLDHQENEGLRVSHYHDQDASNYAGFSSFVTVQFVEGQDGARRGSTARGGAA